MLCSSSIRQPFIAVESVSTVRYFICRDFSAFSQSAPDTWMLVYVDSGDLFVTTQYCRYYLSQNELLLLPPAEIPVFSALQSPPALLICIFSASSPPLYALSDQNLYAAKADRILLAQLLAASAPLSSGSPVMERTASNIMEGLFSRLLNRPNRRLLPVSASSASMPPAPQVLCDQYFQILHYLKSHLNVQLSIEKICRDNLIGRSSLERLFHGKGWNGVMDCFFRIKISAAKRLIASKSLTFTQISAMLGYSSIQYFSRQFKKITKMTPTEYAAFLQEHPGDVISSFFS